MSRTKRQSIPMLYSWGLCPQTPEVFSLANQGVASVCFAAKRKRATRQRHSPHCTTLRFGSILTVAHTLMRQIHGNKLQEAMSRFRVALIFVSAIPQSGSSIHEQKWVKY